MAFTIHKHVDGLLYRRDYKTGKNKTPVELKAVRRNITLTPKYDKEASKWKERTGMSFSAWVKLKMSEVIHTETV